MLPYCDVAHVTKIDMPTRRMPISRIWTVIPSGRLPQTVTSRSILTLPISSKVRAQESLSAENDEKEDIFGSYGFTASLAGIYVAARMILWGGPVSFRSYVLLLGDLLCLLFSCFMYI